MKVLFSSSAERHFLSALDYIRRENPSAAYSFHDRALESLKGLQEYPESGRHTPEFPDEPYREVIVAPFRFFYRIKGDIVLIINVWHDAQILTEPTD